MKKKLKELLTNNNIEGVFKLAYDVFENNTKVFNQFVAYNHKFTSFKNTLNKGLIRESDYYVEINLIVHNILEYIDGIEDIQFEEKLNKIDLINRESVDEIFVPFCKNISNIAREENKEVSELCKMMDGSGEALLRLIKKDENLNFYDAHLRKYSKRQKILLESTKNSFQLYKLEFDRLVKILKSIIDQYDLLDEEYSIENLKCIKLIINYIDMLLIVSPKENFKLIETMHETAKTELMKRLDSHETYFMAKGFSEISEKIENQKKEINHHLDSSLEMSIFCLLDESLLEKLKGEFSYIYEEISLRKNIH